MPYTGGNAELYSHFGKCFGSLLIKKLNIHLPYNPAIPLLDVYLRLREIYIYTKPCKQMFMAALFTVAQNCKLTSCP